MAARLNRCSGHEIILLLDSDSDPSGEEKKTKSKRVTIKKKDSQGQKTKKNESDSDSEYIFDHVRKRNALQKEKASLRIRLRRSTEQSQYKIDTDSEYERPKRKTRNVSLKRTRRPSVEVESEFSQSDCKTPKKNDGKKSDESYESSHPNGTPHKNSRIKRPPLRLSHYYCSTLNYSFENNTAPKAKNNLNQMRDRMVLRSCTPNTEEKDYYSDSSTNQSNANRRETRTMLKNKNRNRTRFMKEDNDSDSSSVASSTTNRQTRNKRNGRTTNTKEVTICDVTPVKTRRLRAGTLTGDKKAVPIEKENDSGDESLIDMYKRKMSLSTNASKTPRTKKASKTEQTPRTPKSRTARSNSLTPSLAKRMTALLKPMTPLQEARARLHVSSVPKSLPCREEEFNNIFTFLKGKLVDKCGGCIYISGVPGTGKTATVNEVVKCLQKLISKGELESFNFVSINGIKLTEPRQSYVQILKQLTGQTLTWEQAYRTLETRFHSSNSKMTLLLVDELDFLCTKRQDVVYNLLDWPTKASAQLVVITIANTMDLPERVLMGRVTSRLGLTRLTFQPYNFKQLQEIVTTRLKDYNAFRSEAVQLVARKVSAVSGDARRALDICRRAMEIAELRAGETISLQDVSEAISEMIATPKVQAIKHCSEMEQIFLQAVSSEVTRTAIEEVLFINAYKQLESLCSFEGIKVPNISETLAICSRLGASRLLICEHSKNDIHQKILLNVSPDDIHYALHQLNPDH